MLGRIRRSLRSPWVVPALVAVGLWCSAAAGSAQAPSETPHPIPTTPPGAVATRPPGIWVDPPPPPDGCVAEAEPNDRPDGARMLARGFCVSGTLETEKDQDLYFYEVAPEDGLVTWDVTVRGVPGAYTSIHVLPLLSEAGVLPIELAPGGVAARVDSDVWIGVPPGTGQVHLAPGAYLFGISRGLPGYEQDLTEDLGYWVEWLPGGDLVPAGDVEPNDSASAATPVAGAFRLSGDLAGSPDVYRWSLRSEDLGTPWRVAVRSSLKTRLTLELSAEDGSPIAYAQATEDGRIAFHDLGLPAGDYLIELQASTEAQPYELWAEPVTDADVDLEPNDMPAQARSVDPATRTAAGRLVSTADVDQFLVDIDAGTAAGLVDIVLEWRDGGLRTLCLSTETGARIACDDGRTGVAFRGMLIPQGRYLLAVSGAAGLDDRYRLRVEGSSVAQPAAETEPNDDPSSATLVAGAFAVSGDLAGGRDMFAWTIDEAPAQQVWHLDASGTPGLSATMELLTSDGTQLARTSLGYGGTARIWDLRLAPGTYHVTLTATSGEAPRYVLRGTPETGTGLDPEPDDTTVQAATLDPATLSARGRIPHRTDVDMYRFELDAARATGLSRVELEWDGQANRQVCLATEFGSQVQCVTGRGGLALTALELAPGPWMVHVSGDADAESRYEVRIVPDGPLTPDRESEPNDREDMADAWATDLVMQGTSRDGDVDLYRVHIPDGTPLIWRLDLAGERLQLPEWRQPDGTHVGSATAADHGLTAAIEDLYLVSGDHLLTVRAGGDYTLSLTPIGPPDLAAEREPNDDADHAGRLVMGSERTGRLPVVEDVDVFRFSLAAPEHVVLTVRPDGSGGGGLDLSGGALDLGITSAGTTIATVDGPEEGGPTVFDGLLPESDYQVWVRPAGGSGDIGAAGIGYAIRLERDDPYVDPGGAPVRPLPVELGVTLDTAEVAAYIADAQRVPGVLHIAGGAAPVELDLDGTTSHRGWRVELPERVTVPTDGLDVPFVVSVAPDAWRDVPVRVSLRLRDGGGAQATTWTEVVPRQDAPPVGPVMAWPVPDALLGGLDAASLGLGGLSPGGDWRADMLHDGLIIAGTGLSRYPALAGEPMTVDVDLAGDDPVPVAGTIIHPLGGAGTFGARPRAFELLLSLDGETWTPVLTAEAGPQTQEQSFVLPSPVPARFARLSVASTWGEGPGPVELGEWKVVATPGWAPSAEPIDLAEPSRGGHVTATDPLLQPAGEMLDSTDTSPRRIYLEPGVPQRFVIGFAEDRAARITGLRWQEHAGADPASLASSVELWVTTESPLGPWRHLGTWQLDRSTSDGVAAFDLPEPTWARFLRLEAMGPVDAAMAWTLPAKVAVLEQPTDDTYRSILGQWGQSSPRGIHELLVPPVVVTPPTDIDAPDAPDGAVPLGPGEVVPGRVARNVDVDWFEVAIPEDDNTLSVDAATERSGDVRIRVIDAAGAEVEGTVVPVEGGTRFVAIVEPGARYRIELSQPILSVVFTFDTSSSIAPWFPMVRAAISSFAGDVRPGFEAVQVFPFEEPDLLEGWSDQAYLIQSAVDAWTTAGGSSALAESITRAATTLIERDGARAVLAVGDAVGAGFLGGLPLRDLEAARPGIFTVHVGGTDEALAATRIMQDLAITNGGHYQYATSLGDMERAFDRMSTWMRRPADYALSVTTSREEYPPGSIEVVPAEGAQVRIGGVAVELILDTSGSMRRPLGDTTRIAVARRSLRKLIETSLPEGLPVALRTFRPGKASCATRLAVRLGPLDRADMLERIAKLRIDRRTRTPLAAAIEAAADDIAEVTGPRIVVVVTDGAETCDGDPEAAVRSLVEAGFDTTVNIVGLALDDEELKARMAAWAAVGGGVFLDAQDQEGLSAAITQTLRAPYRIHDADGALVGQGIVAGDPVEVPMGTYRIEVLADPEPIVLEDVRVQTGQGVRVEVGAAEGSGRSLSVAGEREVGPAWVPGVGGG